MKSRKAQVALEGLATFGVLFMLFVGVYLVAVDKQRSLKLLYPVEEGSSDCEIFSQAVVQAALLGDGSKVTVRLENGLLFEPAGQRVEGKYKVCSLPALPCSFSGVANLSAGKVAVVNEGGVLTYA